MKLIELLVFCAILTVFVRIFTLTAIQISDYRVQAANFMQKTEVVLQKHGEILHANIKGGENAR